MKPSETFLCTFFNSFIWVDPIIAIANRSRPKQKQMQEFVLQSKTNLSYFRDLETAQLGQKRNMEFVEKEQFYHFPWMIDTFLPTQKQFWCLSSREVQEVTGILDNGLGVTG